MAANRQKRTVRAPKLATKAGSLAAITDPGTVNAGAFARKTAASLGNLSEKIGQLSDRVAVKEGEQAGLKAGLDPEFRPSGGFSLFDRAFDQAGIQTFKQKISTAVIEDLETAYNENQNDPGALNDAIDAVAAGHRENIFPEIEADFDALVTRHKLGYMRDATRNFDKQVRAERTAALEGDLSARLRGLEQQAFRLGLDETADEALAGELAALRESLAVTGPDGERLVSPATAGKVLREAEVDIARSRLTGAFSRLETAEEKQKFIGQLSEDFKAGRGVAGAFDLDQFETLENRLQADLRADTAQAAARDRGIGKEVTKFEKAVAEGFSLPESDVKALKGRVAASDNPELIDRYNATVKTLAFVQEARRSRPIELEAFVESERRRLAEKGGTEAEIERFGAAETVLSNMRAELGRDQLGYAARVGLQEVAPLDFSSPEAATASLEDRADVAEEVAAYYGRPVVYFRPEEKQALALAGSVGGDQLIAIAGSVNEALGDQAGAALAEVFSEAPVVAYIGGLSSSRADPATVRDAADGVALRQSEGFKPLLGSSQDTRRAIEGTFGTAFSALPKTGQAAVNTAQAIYEVRARRRGIQESGSGEARALYEEALEAAAGAVTINGEQYGGITRYRGREVLVPTDVRAEEFDQVISTMLGDDFDIIGRPLDVSGAPLGIGDVRSSKLVSIGDGRYLVALGDPDGQDPQYAAGDGPNGLYVLDLKAILPQLRARRPDLFLGGQ